jgi:hypothetical protein
MASMRRSTDMPDAKSRRRRTLAWGALAAIGYAALVLGIVLAVTSQNARVDDVARLTREINDQRRQSLVAACRRDVAQNRAIIGYLKDVGVRPRAVVHAQRFFPTRRDCVGEAVARTRVP